MFRWWRHKKTKTAHAFEDDKPHSLCMYMTEEQKGMRASLQSLRCKACLRTIKRIQKEKRRKRRIIY